MNMMEMLDREQLDEGKEYVFGNMIKRCITYDELEKILKNSKTIKNKKRQEKEITGQIIYYLTQNNEAKNDIIKSILNTKINPEGKKQLKEIRIKINEILNKK